MPNEFSVRLVPAKMAGVVSPTPPPPPVGGVKRGKQIEKNEFLFLSAKK